MTHSRIPLNIGILGAARIASRAIIFPHMPQSRFSMPLHHATAHAVKHLPNNMALEKSMTHTKQSLMTQKSQQFIIRYPITATPLGT